MVKKMFFLILLSLFINSCSEDLLGVFRASYLDDRLKDRNNFIFLTEDDIYPSLGEEFSFIVISDTHIGKGETFYSESLKSAIDTHNAKFAVFLGDITQNGAAEDYEKFIDLANSLEVPVYPVIGNHDIHFGAWSVWENKIGSTSYRIEGDTAVLFILDSANSYFGKEQLDWLENELIGVKKHIFVFTHSNIFAKKIKDIEQLSSTNERARFVSMLKNKCKIMFSGHKHDQSYNKTGGVIFLGVESYINYKSYCLVKVKGSEISYEVFNLAPN